MTTYSKPLSKLKILCQNKKKWSRGVDVKRFLESNASSIPETFFRLGYVNVPRIEEAFDSRNLLPSTALDKKILDIMKCLNE